MTCVVRSERCLVLFLVFFIIPGTLHFWCLCWSRIIRGNYPFLWRLCWAPSVLWTEASSLCWTNSAFLGHEQAAWKWPSWPHKKQNLSSSDLCQAAVLFVPCDWSHDPASVPDQSFVAVPGRMKHQADAQWDCKFRAAPLLFELLVLSGSVVAVWELPPFVVVMPSPLPYHSPGPSTCWLWRSQLSV